MMSTSFPSHRDVIQAIGPNFMDWYRLGIYLKIHPDELDAIKYREHDVRLQCKAFVTLWLELKSNATWVDLCDALKVIGKYGLANRIASKFCSELVSGTSFECEDYVYTQQGSAENPSKLVDLTSVGDLHDKSLLGPKPDRQALVLTNKLQLNRSGPYIK